ncbi:MAG: hypothetical protein JSW33_01585 [bacterium]|nr:MAG: hypothetical protein JSW33_01585 [bacterium]
MYHVIRIIAIFTVILFIISCGSTHSGWGTVTNKSKNWQSSQPDKNGPPAHAPAHGYRAKYKYYYYPSCSIYFDIDRKVYFYLSGENWEMRAELPSSLNVKLGDHVTLELEMDKPYINHKEHQKKYPPGQHKKKQKK